MDFFNFFRAIELRQLYAPCTIVQVDNNIKNKVKLLKNSNLFTYNTDLGHIIDQQCILLTLTGQKPVSMLTTGRWVNTETGRKSIPEDKAIIHDFLSSLGLHSSIKSDDCTTTAIISLDSNLIVKYLDNTNSDAISGALLGYPRTATEAFGDNDLMMDLEEQDSTVSSEGLPECMPNFRFSKLHFKEELEVLRGWYDTLKKYDFIE